MSEMDGAVILLGRVLAQLLPDMAERRRHALLQAAMVFGDGMSPEDAVVFAEKELAEIEKREKHANNVMDELAPVDMILFCPVCNVQHIDEPDELQPMDVGVQAGGWTNPPHKSHLCRKESGGCGTTWRPSDMPTNGVRAIRTSGARDTWRMTRHQS